MKGAVVQHAKLFVVIAIASAVGVFAGLTAFGTAFRFQIRKDINWATDHGVPCGQGYSDPCRVVIERAPGSDNSNGFFLQQQ